jgi:predicted oxidoreductase (fatty acid repression mutant protein)
MNKEVLYMDLDGLLSTLDVVQEEQTAIKRKLSVLLDNVVSNHIIDWAEDIHQQILNREAAVQLLRKDIIALKKTIVQKKSVIYFFDNQYVKMITKYKEQMAYLQNEFNIWSKATAEKFDSILAL